MRIRLKITREIDLPPQAAKVLIDCGLAELVEPAASDPGETAALKSGEREQTRGKQPPPKRRI